MSIADATERRRALDVSKSFCVTAPAGSGKTELLIQRYLALLSRVTKPEQVLAITFTRKAAAEMRERVLQALRAAQQDLPVSDDHQRVTRELASAALAASAAGDWHLGRDISRLNIKTIDSFCAGLTRQMPVLSRFGGQAQATDNAVPLYREAVQELFTLVGTSRPEVKDLEALLLHFDNNWDRLTELLVEMLAKREQWHEYMGARYSPREAQASIERTVAAATADTLSELRDRLLPWQDKLFELLVYAQSNLHAPVPASFPAAIADDLGHWRALASMLLTQQGMFRSTVNVRNGFITGTGEPKERKAQFKDLVECLAAEPGLDAALAEVMWLPLMDSHESSWQLVVHLSHVLPLLAACLLLVFERRGVVDHSQVTLSALDALGDDAAPTELALRLDYGIEHILVDEFQDTALNQYRLIERLTRGWGEHNAVNGEAPRTIFIVGDGMQSIYGFRNANVGLFLTARDQGFNGVVPESVELRCNFRSEEGIVEWVNQSFREAFPHEDNARKGQVGFSDAAAVKPAGAADAIQMHAFSGEAAAQQEAAWLVQQLQAGLADDNITSIAVLGRSRSHLAPILEQLRRQDIPFAAQDMDNLASSPAIVDLTLLCRALANPADRVAWLALLRAPWCALSLADLQAVVGASEHPRYQNLAAWLLQGDFPGTLSERGRTSLARVSECLRWAEQKRDRLALRVWVEQTWEHLGGPACLNQARYLQDAEAFFQLLQEAEAEGAGLSMTWMQERLERLFASSDTPDAPLQVMTLHKAKGLEFDWVFIPALARATRGDSRQLLLWDEYNSSSGDLGIMLAADDHSEAKAPGLYNYLRRCRKQKARLENTRLLYVGTTRAVKRLTLTACLEEREQTEATTPAFKPPGDGSLLAPLWPVFKRQLTAHAAIPEPAQAAVTSRPLLRLDNPPPPPSGPQPVAEEDANIPSPTLNWNERHIGTVIHQGLEQLSLMVPLPRDVPEHLQDQLRCDLATLGVGPGRLDAAEQAVMAALRRTLADDAGGRWLLSAEHADAHSELALTAHLDDQVRDLVIDRTFVDSASGVRWIVDYKSSVPAEGMALEDFLCAERERYRPQLLVYRNALAARASEPVRCALYFTGLGLLHPIAELDQD
ncbi:AAA family ATPase [Pseudohalioglobus sediminis]|uniref:DNA 3'-5' helicase n=1 Tax=Pseudohalioglobus sediminis TaxID=2606449 RepID=A0A5B0X358_9GAMM|nr:UvrD-helicase domain-containing protein [Pseudohalioglobus sediminis]KAA1193125.1 AAA family ATPase [Pseudohalioglobus sediminis]